MRREALANLPRLGRELRLLATEVRRHPARPVARTTLYDLPDVMRDTRLALRETRCHHANPPADGIVADIGAGHGGHERADLILDKYIVDSFERSGTDIDFTRPIVVADGHQLPIKDGALAYVIAAHVLEHATDPVAFAAELSRVAEAGFVQVPSRESELTFGWPFHPWLVDRVGDRLTFEPRGSAHASAGELLHDGFAESPAFRLWFASHRSRWHHSIEWRGDLEVEVAGTSAALETASFDLDGTLDALRDADRRGALRPLTPALRSILCCPVCRADLVDDSHSFVCTGCGRTYPAAGGVPVLLPEVAIEADRERSQPAAGMSR